MSSPLGPEAALADLLRRAGRPLDPRDGVSITGSEPVYRSRFPIATAGAAAIAATGLAAADLWRLRGGRGQTVGLSLSAAAAALRSEHYLRIAGEPPESSWSSISGFYRTRDGRWLQLHCNFPHHRDGTLALLGCGEEREAIAAAVAAWDGRELEEAIAAAGLCAGLARSRDEWLAHPQGRAVQSLPLIEIERVGESPPEPPPEGDRPLAGVRVLDLTRVIAGPLAGRTLAEHGADVLRVTAAHLPGFPGNLDIEFGFGKLSAQLDLRSEAERERVAALLDEADVFLQSYRPGTLAQRGLSLEEAIARRPGLVYATLSAYGHAGPWRDRRGFDTLVQSVSGIADEEGGDEPRHLPTQALDHVSGYLLAFGVMAALARRAREGGSYLVRASLAQTGAWIEGLGRTDPEAASGFPEDPAELLGEMESPLGRLRYLRPIVRLTETPPRWTRPPVPLDASPAAWPTRG